MYKSTIMIKDIDTAREFVDKMSGFMDADVILNSGDYSIDGHSIIGIISLDITKPIEVVLNGNVTDELTEIIEQYAI
ncbi:MAG: HPr family phosphocarrier protein [Ruminococcus sp.]|nr:HPr family phosphocarrier protein [Ruminococcus sp.]MBQ7133765.1 HPr family phosphocarrier protein [Ruminococcus sp.]